MAMRDLGRVPGLGPVETWGWRTLGMNRTGKPPPRLRAGLFPPAVLRLLHVRSLSRSIAMETGREVLAALRFRPLERRGKFRPNRNRGGSPDQRRDVVQRRKSLHTRVSAIRSHPATPFENRGKSPHWARHELVRKGDGGGGDGPEIGRSPPHKLLF